MVQRPPRLPAWIGLAWLAATAVAAAQVPPMVPAELPEPSGTPPIPLQRPVPVLSQDGATRPKTSSQDGATHSEAARGKEGKGDRHPSGGTPPEVVDSGGLFRPFERPPGVPVLGERLLERPGHRPRGIPLRTTSWRNRPSYAAVMLGTATGDELVRGRVEQHSTFMSGFWLGHDFSHHWGGEMRLGLAYPAISTVGNAVTPSGRQEWWDVQLLGYPWGDARFRPYYKIGLGVTGVHFQDDQGNYFNRGLVTLPFGFGMKYLWRKHVALRLDVTDNLAFGSGAVSTMHSWSFLLGVEARFGGPKRIRFRH